MPGQRPRRIPSPVAAIIQANEKALATQQPAEHPLTLEERNARATKHLAARFDALNQAIIVAEQRLKGLKPPQDVWVSYKSLGDEFRREPAEYALVGICKIADQWRLAHATDHENNHTDPPYGIQPLANCPVETRVEAVQYLQKLHERIVAAKEEFIPKVEKAVQSILDYCQNGGQS